MKMGVVGAGLMGREIAFVYAMAGWNVVLADKSQTQLDQALSILGELVGKGVKRGLFEQGPANVALERIHASTELEAMHDVKFVVEAVFEQESVKAEVLEKLDQICSECCILASNTSTIPISTLASYLSIVRRRRFVGTHYFSPVSRMKLVEVIPAFDTSEETTAYAMKMCSNAGKTPVRIKDVAGFAVNRMLHSFMIEAVRLVEEGVATPEDLDTACRLGLGHAMGPFELMDAVTADLCVEAQEIMQEAYGERFRPPALLKQRVRAGLGGGHGRRGWREHTKKPG
ncbi:3-hydroxyacyl-CoA dehydrogenase [Kineobactrum sediminis]|uniref:3-hydroxyacyl-CoA dehydrogenase n=1 Tax=Kineobactrum sediminis TaxID=1905677 RepID=A0A2N5Y076_9GAMM|nr:3-hydroxyacyl-CoA dehydrogenase family protein [Kineobactrum sediminis]PLW81795.1 3-hydroxyacyl-CoA dehydrogenase [Kineobactrum sediminis]